MAPVPRRTATQPAPDAMERIRRLLSHRVMTIRLADSRSCVPARPLGSPLAQAGAAAILRPPPTFEGQVQDVMNRKA